MTLKVQFFLHDDNTKIHLLEERREEKVMIEHLCHLHILSEKSTLKYQIFILIVEIWNVQPHWVLLLQHQLQFLGMGLEVVLGVKSCPLLKGNVPNLEETETDNVKCIHNKMEQILNRIG